MQSLDLTPVVFLLTNSSCIFQKVLAVVIFESDGLFFGVRISWVVPTSHPLLVVLGFFLEKLLRKLLQFLFIAKICFLLFSPRLLKRL